MNVSINVHSFEKLKSGHCYLYKSESGESTLIDSGLPGESRLIIAQLEALGIDIRSISYIILTHADVDHTGNALLLKSLTGAKIAAHRLEKPYLLGKKKKRHGLPGIIANILSLFIRTPAVHPDIELQDEVILGGLRVIHCPGHSEGSIALLGEDGTLFSGDAVLTDKTGRIIGYSPVFSANIPQAEESLTKLGKLEFTRLLPGHGSPVTEEASERLQGYISTRT